MPRRSSFGRSARPAPRAATARKPTTARRFARSAVRAATARNPPQPVRQSSSGGSMLGAMGSTIAHSSGESMLGAIASTVAHGAAFGAGFAVAHGAVAAVVGPRAIRHETVVYEASAPTPTAPNSGGSDACNMQTKAFLDCLNSSGSDISKCQFYIDMLADCCETRALRRVPK